MLLVLVVPLSADADNAGVATIHVRNTAQFAAAAQALRNTGGTIKLRRHHYDGELVVGTRSTKPLRIIGESA